MLLVIGKCLWPSLIWTRALNKDYWAINKYLVRGYRSLKICGIFEQTVSCDCHMIKHLRLENIMLTHLWKILLIVDNVMPKRYDKSSTWRLSLKHIKVINKPLVGKILVFFVFGHSFMKESKWYWKNFQDPKPV